MVSLLWIDNSNYPLRQDTGVYFAKSTSNDTDLAKLRTIIAVSVGICPSDQKPMFLFLSLVATSYKSFIHLLSGLLKLGCKGTRSACT